MQSRSGELSASQLGHTSLPHGSSFPRSVMDPSPFVFSGVLLLFLTFTLTVLDQDCTPPAPCSCSWFLLFRVKFDSMIVVVDGSFLVRIVPSEEREQ